MSNFVYIYLKHINRSFREREAEGKRESERERDIYRNSERRVRERERERESERRYKLDKLLTLQRIFIVALGDHSYEVFGEDEGNPLSLKAKLLLSVVQEVSEVNVEHLITVVVGITRGYVIEHWTRDQLNNQVLSHYVNSNNYTDSRYHRFMLYEYKYM